MSESSLLNKQNIEIVEKYNKNFRWFMENLERIRNENRGTFVAIYNEDVVASDRDPEALLVKIEKSGITDIDSVFRKYIPENDDLLVI